MPKGNGKPIPKVTIDVDISNNKGRELLATLESRFTINMHLHKGIEWSHVRAKLEANPNKLASLIAMEATAGEPDVVGYDEKNDEYLFFDCSPETPERRSICYDQKGEDERTKKGVYPGGNALSIADKMGIEVLDEEQYNYLQKLGEFDTKTSSWIKTPDAIRKLGGALFADRRFDHVFIYHNTAASFYGARGFRGCLRI